MRAFSLIYLVAERVGGTGRGRAGQPPPQGRQIAAASALRGGRGHALIADAASGAEIIRLDSGSIVRAVTYSPSGTRVGFAFGDTSRGRVHVFDVLTGTKVSDVEFPTGRLYSISFSPDEDSLAIAVSGAGRDGGSVRLTDLLTGTEVWRTDLAGRVHTVAFSPDGTKVIAAAGRNPFGGSAQALDAANGTELWRLGFNDTVAITFSPDGTRVGIAVGSERVRSGSALVVDASSGAEIWKLEHDGPVNAIAFSPDDARVATASGGARGGSGARVVDAKTGEQITRIDHDSEVHAVTFSADGNRIATASGDDPRRGGSATVIDAATGTEVCRLDHNGPVRAVAFSLDGTRVATASSDHSVRVWCVDASQLIEQAMDRLTRNLTRQEWKRYFRDEPYRKVRPDLP